jgi:hypothetical protein
MTLVKREKLELIPVPKICSFVPASHGGEEVSYIHRTPKVVCTLITKNELYEVVS